MHASALINPFFFFTGLDGLPLPPPPALINPGHIPVSGSSRSAVVTRFQRCSTRMRQAFVLLPHLTLYPAHVDAGSFN